MVACSLSVYAPEPAHLTWSKWRPRKSNGWSISSSPCCPLAATSPPKRSDPAWRVIRTAPAPRRSPGCSSATRTSCATSASRSRSAGCRRSTPPRATASTATPTRCRAVELTPDEAAAVAVATQLWESPELITATQGALLKLRAAGVDVDPDSAPVAIASPAGRAGAARVGGRARNPVVRHRFPAGRAVSASAVAGRALHHPHRRAVGRGHREGPLVSRRPRPRPRRHPHLPALADRRRRHADRPRRRGHRARRTSTCARSWPTRSARRRPVAQAVVWVADGRATALRRAGRSVGAAATGRPRRRRDRTRHRIQPTGWRARSPATGPTPSCSSRSPLRDDVLVRLRAQAGEGGA